MENFLEKLLKYYNLSFDDYKQLTKEENLIELPDILNVDNIKECISFIKSKILNKEKILIYGDYDCDGICATTIMYLTLKTPDFTPGFYIPTREKDGYGLTNSNIDRFYDLGYKTIILVDNGISLNSQIDYANSKGIDVIIFDHHIKNEELPNAKYIFHPIYSKISDVNLSAGALSFLFSKAYLSFVDEYLLFLGSLSIISDLMELKNINRDLVRLGIKVINNNKYKNIISLIDKEYEYIDEDMLSMYVIPKINSIGRLIDDNSIYDIVRFLINYKEHDFDSKKLLWINNINQEKKQLINSIKFDQTEFKNKKSIVININNIKEGLIGLLASKLLNEYKIPTIIFTESSLEKNILKGSIRTGANFDITIVFEKLNNLLESYGGHKNAGGISIKKENYDIFVDEFNKMLIDYHHEDKEYIDINIGEINFENFEIIKSLSPFGQGFKKPLFLLKDINLNTFNLSNDQKHAFYRISQTSRITYFNFDKTVLESSAVDLEGTFSLDLFKGYKYINFLVTDFVKK